MYIKINKPTEAQNRNCGSCTSLVSYLEKENEMEGLKLEEHKMFFDQNSDMVPSYDVINRIDNNTSKLSKNESRFYMHSINPSQAECKHIAKQITGRNVSDLSEMTLGEIKSFDKSLQDYSRKVMDEYAAGFNKGLTGNDILYFGKVEHERKYDRLSDEVKLGSKKAGELKEGFQAHVHIVVSRKDMSDKIRLSPFSNHKDSKNTLNGKQVQIGFNRKEFIGKTERIFDDLFKYQRPVRQSFEYRYGIKNMAASIAKSYANQLSGGVYFDAVSAKKMVENISNIEKDPLKVLTGALYKNEEFRNISKVVQMAARPEKIVLEVAKKLPAMISKAATLKI